MLVLGLGLAIVGWLPMLVLGLVLSSLFQAVFSGAGALWQSMLSLGAHCVGLGLALGLAKSLGGLALVKWALLSSSFSLVVFTRLILQRGWSLQVVLGLVLGLATCLSVPHSWDGVVGVLGGCGRLSSTGNVVFFFLTVGIGGVVHLGGGGLAGLGWCCGLGWAVGWFGFGIAS